MIYRNKKNNTRFGIAMVLVWALLCPEIYMQSDWKCLERADGLPISEEEANQVWEKIFLGDLQDGEVSYKIGLLEWLKEQGYS